MANVLADVFRDRVPPLKIVKKAYGDNSAANLMSRHQCSLRKVRHVALSDLYIREVTENGDITVHDIESSRNRGDSLTKIMNAQRLQPCLSHLNLV